MNLIRMWRGYGPLRTYVDGVMIRPEKLPVNNTVKYSEDTDAKNEEQLKMFVLERKELVIYWTRCVRDQTESWLDVKTSHKNRKPFKH